MIQQKNVHWSLELYIYIYIIPYFQSKSESSFLGEPKGSSSYIPKTIKKRIIFFIFSFLLDLYKGILT
jgi:hypothetical protein